MFGALLLAAVALEAGFGAGAADERQERFQLGPGVAAGEGEAERVEQRAALEARLARDGVRQRLPGVAVPGLGWKEGCCLAREVRVFDDGVDVGGCDLPPVARFREHGDV